MIMKKTNLVHTHAVDVIRSHVFPKKKGATSWKQSDVTSKRLLFYLLDIGLSYGKDYFLTEFNVGNQFHNSLFLFHEGQYNRVGAHHLSQTPSFAQNLRVAENKQCAVLVRIDGNVWIGNDADVSRITQFFPLDDTHPLPDFCVWIDIASIS